MKDFESVGKYNFPPFTGLAGVPDIDRTYATFPNVFFLPFLSHSSGVIKIGLNDFRVRRKEVAVYTVSTYLNKTESLIYYSSCFKHRDVTDPDFKYRNVLHFSEIND